ELYSQTDKSMNVTLLCPQRVSVHSFPSYRHRCISVRLRRKLLHAFGNGRSLPQRVLLRLPHQWYTHRECRRWQRAEPQADQQPHTTINTTTRITVLLPQMLWTVLISRVYGSRCDYGGKRDLKVFTPRDP